ncbi:hypothetical protein F5Y15DRAFT_62635 [Xylariaceae sp. FL0016]|nr:hypothetical protein F5Y15DRAFT_62635 [Xylariaceae sp. FL0016]
MSYLPAKRQRSNTSRESADSTPQTAAPALRQSPQIHSNIAVGPYSPTTYGNDPYAPQPSHQNIAYGSYSASPVTLQHNGYGGGYHTSSNAYTTATYSPQQTANAYATQYAQPQPSAQYSSHAGPYTQTALNGLHNGGFSQSPTPQPPSAGPYSPITSSHHTTTHHTANYQQTQPPPIHHSQQPIPQYRDPYASQSPPQATPYHSNHSSYSEPSMSQHQYSPAPLPTPQNDNPPILEESPENDDEDAQGEIADDYCQVYRAPEPPTTASIPTPSTEHSKPEANRCSCKKGRGKKKACISCICSKYGLNCTSACSCRNACGNPFADLTTFFGPTSLFPKPCGANACFATWLANQPNIEELDTDLMVDMLLYDDASWANIREYADAFRNWETKWKKASGGKGKKNRDERERLEFELLRGGLGNCNQDDFNGHWYSFCQRKWVPTDLWTHCLECRECKSSSEWHCDKHDRCTKDRVCSACAAAPYQDIVYPAEPGTT